MTIHSLRHIFAIPGLALEGRAEGLDNSNIAITLDLYPHVLPNMQDELAGLAANLLKR